MKATMTKRTTPDGPVLVPVLPADVVRISKYHDGEVLEVTHRKDRFYPLLQKYWATCEMIAHNHKEHGLEDLDTREKVDEYVRLKVGHVDYRIVVKGHVHIKTKSISYDALGQDEFKDFYNKALTVFTWMSGISEHDIEHNWSDYA